MRLSTHTAQLQRPLKGTSISEATFCSTLSVRRGHREFQSVHPRESVVGFAGRHLAAPSAHPFAKRPQRPVGQPTEHFGRMVGPIVVTEAANDRIGLLNLDTDGEGVVAEQA